MGRQVSFADDIKGFTQRTEARARRVFEGVVFEAHRSITLGSPLTGAPGQPVETGTLRNSYQIEWDRAAGSATVASEMRYARPIEDGISGHGTPIRFRSQVGGAHSIKLTVAGFGKIVAHVNAKEQSR